MMTLQEMRKALPKVTVAIAEPYNTPALEFALILKNEGHTPILCGDPERIRQAAKGMDIGDIKIQEKNAIKTAYAREAEALVNGSMDFYSFAEDVLTAERELNPRSAVAGVGLYETSARTLFITDPLCIPLPTLVEKVWMTEQVTKVAKSCGLEKPKIAALTAVEKVDPVHQQSTVDAATLAKMNSIGQLKGMLIDGPLALDLAMSSRAAEIKGINSPVAGAAEVLLAPDIESAQLMGSTLTLLAKANQGIALMGSMIPVGFAYVSDGAEARMNALAFAWHLRK